MAATTLPDTPQQQQQQQQPSSVNPQHSSLGSSSSRASGLLPASWLAALHSVAVVTAEGPGTLGTSTSSTSLEAEDDLQQEHDAWGAVCPSCTTPSLATRVSCVAPQHRDSSSGGGGSAAPAVLWSLGSLQPGVFAGAFCGVPVRLSLTASEDGIMAQVGWLPAQAQQEQGANMGEQRMDAQHGQQEQRWWRQWQEQQQQQAPPPSHQPQLHQQQQQPERQEQQPRPP